MDPAPSDFGHQRLVRIASSAGEAVAVASLIEIERGVAHPLGARTVIGRDTACQIHLDDPLVSPVHAELVRQSDGAYRIMDLASRRGVYVGSQRITEAVLADGDELVIGPVRLRFDAPPARATEPPSALRALTHLARDLSGERDPARLAARVLDTCFELLRADRGAIVVYEPPSRTPVATVARDRGGRAAPLALSAAVLGQVMLTREPYLRVHIDDDLALQRSESLAAGGVRSVMAVPLYDGAAEWLGVILLDACVREAAFSARDLELVAAIAAPAALALHGAQLARRAARAADSEWHRLARVVSDLPHGVVVLDGERRCVLVNRWAAAHPDELGSLTPGEPVEVIAGIHCDVLTATDQRTIVTTGTRRVLAVSARTAAEGGETVVVIDDITAQHTQQSEAAHRDRVALVGQLAGGIAHDFNNLLHVILMYANMLEDALAEAAHRDDAREIKHAATSAARLTRQLLTFSRRDLALPRVTDVVAVARGLESMLQRALGPDISLSLECQVERAHVLIDPAQLEQVLLNLVVNARDAIRGAGHIRIAIAERTPGPRDGAEGAGDAASSRAVTIEVADSGEGMPPEVAARVFEPYFTTKERGKGTGLGLATVHGIVRHAGGQIDVSSMPGHGATFRIAIPSTDREPVDAGQPGDAHLAAPARILLVDDDPAVLRVTERALRHAGYEVTTADSGSAARLALRERSSFELLLTDVVMPGMSGRELAREIDASATQVLFMSGYHPSVPIASPHFLAKPFDRRQLLDKVHGALAAHRAGTPPSHHVIEPEGAGRASGGGAP